MPVNISCIMFFGSAEGKGWAEKHVIQGNDPPGDLLPFLITLKNVAVNLRRPLLGEDCYLKGLRVSYATATGNVRSSADRFQPLLGPGNQFPSSAPADAVQMRMGESTNSQFSNTFLRGFWRDVQRDEQLDFTTGTGNAFKALLDAYVAGLVSLGFGWEGQNAGNTRKGIITGYDTVAGGFIKFTTDITSGPVFGAPGSQYSMRIAGLNGSGSALNGTHVVQVIDATHVQTILPTAALPFASNGLFTITSKSFLAYTGMQYAQLAKRSMGRPTLVSRTRRPPRARG